MNKKNSDIDPLLLNFGETIFKNIVTKATPFLQQILQKDNLDIKNNEPKQTRYDLYKDDQSIYILYRIPGVDKKDINVYVTNNKLFIQGEARLDWPMIKTIIYNDMITVPNYVTKKDLSVSCQNGLLKIKIKKQIVDKIEIM